MIWSIFKSAAI